MDKLENIFELQDVLNRRIGVKMDEMNDEDRAKWILNYVRAMQQELAELTDSVPWKWWAKYQEFDKQNAKVEIVDLFHFLISLAQVMGMSADDVHEAYLKKNKVNHNRQESGYSEKDEDDSRHIFASEINPSPVQIRWWYKNKDYKAASRAAQRDFLRATLFACTNLLLLALSNAEIRDLAALDAASLSLDSAEAWKALSKVFSLLDTERFLR